MLPGTLTSTVFGDQLQVWLEDPSRINYWLIALVLGFSASRPGWCGAGSLLPRRRPRNEAPVDTRVDGVAGGCSDVRSRRVAIGSYNIHNCVGWDRRRLPARIADVLRELDCDIYALQEVDNDEGDDEDSMQLEYLSRALRYGGDSGPAHRSSQRPVRQRRADAPADRQRASSRPELLAIRAARRARRASSISAITTCA